MGRSAEDLAKANAHMDEIFDAARIPSQPTSGALFHYSSADGLRDILETGEMFASHVGILNDTTEFSYGMALVRPRLAALADSGFAEVAAKVGRALDERIGCEVFATCFCEEDDLLPQWQGYGAAGSGYSIGFRSATLGLDGDALLLPVSYGDDEAVRRADGAVQWAVHRLRKATDDRTALDAFTTLAVCLLLVATSSKQKVFSHEREWRLLNMQLDKAGNAELSFRNVGGLSVPYVRVAVPRHPASGKLDLVSVRCGPTLFDTATERAVELLLSKCGLEGVPVLRSKAPLRR